MIIEYRISDSAHMCSKPVSYVKRTYKDVTSIETARGGVTYLHGIIPAEVDTTEKEYPRFIRYAQNYVIAAIHLAPGEYLEVVDVPRD